MKPELLATYTSYLGILSKLNGGELPLTRCHPHESRFYEEWESWPGKTRRTPLHRFRLSSVGLNGQTTCFRSRLDVGGRIRQESYWVEGCDSLNEIEFAVIVNNGSSTNERLPFLQLSLP